MAMTNRHLGALLVAIGTQMVTRDLSFGAALDGHSDDAIQAKIEELLPHEDIPDHMIEMSENEIVAEMLGVPLTAVQNITW